MKTSLFSNKKLFFFLLICVTTGLMIVRFHGSTVDPDVDKILSIVKYSSDDELWQHHIKMRQEHKDNGHRPQKTWSVQVCQYVFDRIVEEILQTNSEDRVRILFFYLYDFTLIQKDHFVLGNLCTDRQFDAIQHRFEQYNANTDFRGPKLSIVKMNSETEKSAIGLYWTYVRP